ncbi:hypothetical protein AVEN_186026-1 [Araneus ventricosus]|uniref:Uncharacterized protein n=1 Tax=Araneus ventricosus TaxID=182803 RepID=A0A4Y2JDC7_ARAVE|nr:hypothetical protein AVEN_186026-1 [Araneus ventricosus]
MRSIIYILFGILVVFFKRDEKTFALAAWSIQTQSVPEEHLEAIKVEFSKPVVEALLRFSGFQRKFGVPYLYVRSALTYATEIAKATAYSPLFSSSEGIEDFALKHLLRMVLSSSPVYCTDVNCAASTIGEILAEIITEGGFVTHRVSNHVIKMYAGNLAGNILWRLSRLPDPDSHMSESLKDAPPEIVNDYAQVLRFLSLGIRNSTLVSEFCEDEGIDADTLMILLNSVCGSRFLNFKIGLSSDLTTKMLEAYTFAKRVLPQDLEFSQSFSVISSIVAETVTFSMIRQGYLKGDEDLEETSRDVLKMILLGITTSKMDLGSSNSFVKYSSFKNKKVSRTSKSLKRTILEKVSSELSDSEIFQRLFNHTEISSPKLEEYASAIAEGITHSVSNISEDLSTTIAESFARTLSPTAKFIEENSSKDSVKMFSDGISKTLFYIVSQFKVVDFDKNSSSDLRIFHEIVQNILLSLEKLEETASQTEESVISDPLKKSIPVPKSIFDMMSTVSNFFSSIW